MDSDINKGVRIIAAIICIVIGSYTGSNIYEFLELDINSSLDDKDFSHTNGNDYTGEDIKRYAGNSPFLPYFYSRSFYESKSLGRKSEREDKLISMMMSYEFYNLFISLLIFCVSLCCFTYICVKK